MQRSVAFPRSAEQARAAILAASNSGLSVTPRGAGSGLAGGAIGDGLIVDFSRHNRQITGLDLERECVRVGAGVVLDQLNTFLRPHGFCFGPDVATSSRATLGGMIANNSSGARVPVYGTAADHVRALEILLADGRIETIAADRLSLGKERDQIAAIVRQIEPAIAARMPPGLLKRWSGYGLRRFLHAPENLCEILGGSEGTLAAIFSAELKIVRLPREKGLGLIFFDSVAGLESIMRPLGLEACYYGHAATGLLHVRPVIDLHSEADIAKLRQVTSEVAALVRQFKGSLAAEHGVGIARTEFMPDELGEDLFGAMREIKRVFDPGDLFNPGKILSDGRFKLDHDLRWGAGYRIELPFEPVLAFAAKDHSFVGNLEQCNGCGGCRKDAPTMCPTFLATGEEYMSTRAALDLRVNGEDPLRAQELDDALSNCLSCKACTTECPSNVNLALLKAELLHARYARDGLPLRVRMLSDVDSLGKLGCFFPALANFALDFPPLRKLMQMTLGISKRRILPHYARERFDRWFVRRANRRAGSRGKVILWDDTFVRYHEPHIGIAAVSVLEALGFEVELPKNRTCCGRPAFSQGNLGEAARLGRHNLQLFSSPNEDTSILFLEPSCYSMFVEDYRELKLPEADRIAQRCHLFEKFVDDLLAREPTALTFERRAAQVAIHAHCHAKSLLHPGFMARLAERLPGRRATLLDTGCCGMAGAFGMLESKYELSLEVAAPLIERVMQRPPGAIVVASGTSCRHQIEDLAKVHPKHMAELLAEAIAQPNGCASLGSR